jgi:CPA2 family monovalent cation:H+ antiporter-2
LVSLGANEVIPEEFETSIEIFARVLQRFGVSRGTIEEQISRIRQRGYEMLRSPSTPQIEMGNLNEAMHKAVTRTVRLGSDSPAVGQTLGQLDLRGKTGATVIAVIRDGEPKISPGAKYKLCENDTILLSGSPEKTDAAIMMLEPEAAESGFNP